MQNNSYSINEILLKMEPVRVLHVFNFFDQGGIENFVMNVYRNIDRSKIQFDFAFPENKKGYFDEEAKALGANIYFFDSNKKSFGNYNRNLRRIIQEHGPYVAIHSHIYYFSGFVLYIAKKCGVKIRISHSHETQKGRKQTLIRRIYEKVMRRMIKANATDWLCCSEKAGDFVFGKSIPYQVLYNGIDMRRFQFRQERRDTIRKELGVEGKKVILNVGRFAEQKNHPFILKIFNHLLEISEDYRLVMIGGGPLEDFIREKCKEYGFYDKCFFLYNVQNAEDYYCAADIFILPSLYEGMGIVLVEAQATGLRTIISDKVPREINVTNLATYLSIDHTEQEWAETIDKQVYMAIDRNIYNVQFAGSPFDVKRTVKDLTDIYLRNE